MRARVLLMLLGLIVAMVVVGAALAVRDAGKDERSDSSVAVAFSDLQAGEVTPITVVLPRSKAKNARVFFVRQENNHVDAFLGVSPHLGCALVTRGDPTYAQPGINPNQAPFEDPCGGSTYALNGDCVGGPCPRGLDRYVVHVTDGTARINLERLVPGTPRAARSRS